MQEEVQGLAQNFSREAKIARANYLAGESPLLDDLNLLVQKLRMADISLPADDEKKAFFINVYNGFTNYHIVKNRLSGGLITNLTMFFWPKIQLGQYHFSLDDIEHGILRKNEKASYKLTAQFSKTDPRRKLMVAKLDARIHFALNCGAASCPPIAFYDAENIETQLDLAEKSFAEGNFIVDKEKKQVLYSKLYAMYKDDFGNSYLADPAYHGYRFRAMKYNTAFA